MCKIASFHMILTRNVQSQDIPEIKRISDSLVVTSDSLNKSMGFYDYSLTLEQYKRRSNSNLFLVDYRNSELEGFCMAFDSEFVRELVKQEEELKKDVVFNHLASLNEDYVYIDQFAVKRPKSLIGNASACRLVDKIKEMSDDKESLIVAVAHYPWKNNIVIRFCKHQGAELVKEIGSREYIIFGVYRLGLLV